MQLGNRANTVSLTNCERGKDNTWFYLSFFHRKEHSGGLIDHNCTRSPAHNP